MVLVFLRGAGEFPPEEGRLYYYWVTILQLLKRGIPWNAIQEFSENEINLVIGIDIAIEQKQAEDQARQTAPHMPTI